MYSFQHLSQEQKENLNKIWDTDYQTIVRGKDNGVPFLSYVFQLHKEIFGETCSNCPNKIQGYIQKLKKLKTDNIVETKKQNTFVLQNGTIIPIAGTSQAYSNSNLTDEKAVELLAANKNRKSLFAKLPENWEELVKAFLSNTPSQDTEGAKVEGVKIGENGFSVEESLSLLEKLNVKTKATTITGVEGVIKKLSPELTKDLVELADALASSKTIVPGTTDSQDTERTKSVVEFELAQAEQELEDLVAIAPQDTEGAKVLSEKVEALKVELETL